MSGCFLLTLGSTLLLPGQNIKNYYKKNKYMISLPVSCAIFGILAFVFGVWCVAGGGGKLCGSNSNSSPSGDDPEPDVGPGDDPEPDVGPATTCYYSSDGIKYNSEDTLTDFITASSDSWSRCYASANGCAATL